VLSSIAAALTGLGTVGAGLIWRRPDPIGVAAPATGTRAARLAPLPSPTPDLLAAVRVRIETYLRETAGRITVAVRDQVTSTELTVGSRRFETASIVKVDILAALLLRQQRQRDRELSDADRQRVRSMIVNSDNDAATALFQTIGGAAGLTAANRTFGLRETTSDPHWGLTTTTAADQVRLLAAITAAGPLSARSRQQLLELMGQVQDDQRWGITAAINPASTNSYVKNGWLQDETDGNRWKVNSIGRLVEPGHDWLIAVLSDHHATQRAGIQMVEGVAEYTLRELRGLPAVTVP
jgi:beta-lactamase class A